MQAKSCNACTVCDKNKRLKRRTCLAVGEQQLTLERCVRELVPPQQWEVLYSNFEIITTTTSGNKLVIATSERNHLNTPAQHRLFGGAKWLMHSMQINEIHFYRYSSVVAYICCAFHTFICIIKQFNGIILPVSARRMGAWARAAQQSWAIIKCSAANVALCCCAVFVML